MEIRGTPSSDLIGQKFNYLTIEQFKYEPGNWWMIVRCDCGNLAQEKIRKLKNGQRKTCGVIGCPHFHNVRKTNGRNGNFTGHEDIYGSRWMLWKISAEKRDLEFSISIQYAWQLFVNQNRKCALSGIDLSFGNAWNRQITASLDRIDSSKGYVEGNVQWVHKDINIMKREMTDEQFIQLCEQVVKYRKVPNKN